MPTQTAPVQAGQPGSPSAGEPVYLAVGGKTAFVSAEDRPPLPEGEYYHHQIIGLNVFDETGTSLGVVSEILETGANDVYVVAAAGGREILIPALKDVLLEINLEQKRMKVHLLPGLLDQEGLPDGDAS